MKAGRIQCDREDDARVMKIWIKREMTLRAHLGAAGYTLQRHEIRLKSRMANDIMRVIISNRNQGGVKCGA